MANVLGDLFGSIASAIREKTGDTGTIKPSQFPDKIHSIITKDVSSLPISYAIGDFKPNKSIYTFEHNLGDIPDILIVYDRTMKVDPPIGAYMKSAIGFSNKLNQLLLQHSERPGKVIYGLVMKDATTGEKVSGGTAVGSDNYCITDNHESQQEIGSLRNATETSCVIGGTFIPMDTTMEYSYIAIGGLL